MIPSEIQPESPDTPQSFQTEAEAQAARLVTERLNEITKRAKRVTPHLMAGCVLGFAVLILACILTVELSKPHKPPRLLSDVVYYGGVLLIPALSFWFALRVSPKFEVEEIARLGGVEAIPPLLAVLKNNLSSKQNRAIRLALTALLPQMKASDAPLLTPAARYSINTWLWNTCEIGGKFLCSDALRLASLKALEQVGDSSSISTVEKLTRMKPRTPSQEKIKQAAIECLPMLRAHCGDVETARTLLRASQSEAARPGTLLRPASGAGQTDSAELLRGTDAPKTQE